jgi:hypothetical protein
VMVVLVVVMLVMAIGIRVFGVRRVDSARRLRSDCVGCPGCRGIGKNCRRKHVARGRLMRLVVIMLVIVMRIVVRMIMGVIVRVLVRVLVIVTMIRAGMIMLCMIVFSVAVVGGVTLFGMRAVGVLGPRDVMVVERLVFVRLGCLGRIGLCVPDDLALDAFAAAAAARTAVTLPPPAGAVLTLFFGLAVGALVGLDQGLPVGDRYLVVVGMDFAEGEKAVAVSAVFDEGRLERRFYPRNLGEVDVAAQLLALGGFEIKFFDAVATDHDDPGLFRMGGIDQHFVGHF